MLIFPGPMFAQSLIETGMLDTVSTTFTIVATSVENSIQDHPWIWIGVVTLFLMLMMRPRR